LPALAQDPNCPPGAWFCEETDVAPPPAKAPAKPAEPAQPAPDAGPDAPAKQAPPRAGTVVVPPPQGRGAPPPVVIYQPVPSAPPPQVIIVAPGRPVRAVPPPPPPKRKWRREWGLNLRLEGVALGGSDEGAAHNAGMGGLGFSIRYRPVPAFAIDFGVDIIGGIDYNGFERAEIPLSLSGILYVNPKNRVQFYFLGGLDHSHAHVHSDEASPLLSDRDATGYSNDYTYLGGHGGIGLEFRLSKRIALNVDMLGFVRDRIDEGRTPEFVNERGETTNSSGGGLFRGGLTFWW
jgi:hypothetical protein